MILQPVPFKGWEPDKPDFANSGDITATNVIPKSTSYGPLPDLSAQSGALDERARGAFAAKDTAGNTYFYAGDATKLYEVRSSAVTDKSSAVYTNAADSNWMFAQYKGLLVATNYDDAVQSITLGSVGNFADHITSTDKPKARDVATVRDFLVLGNINDEAGVSPNRVRWSAFEDSQDFDEDATTLSDKRDLPIGGQVQRVIGGAEYGVIFQERQIVRMSFEGAPTIFRFDAVDRRRGTPFPGGVIEHGRLIYYPSEEGLMVFDGTTSHPIGDQRVDREFLSQLDVANRHRVSSAIDLENKLVIWALPGSGSQSGAPNKLFIYYWPGQKWAEADLETEIIARAETEAFTLETLDTPFSSDIDGAEQTSFDSSIWKGGVYRLAAFDTAHKLAYFTGSNLAATIDTADIQLFPGQRALVNSVRSLVDGGTVTVAVGGRARLVDTLSFDTATAINDIGQHDARNNNRYHRFRTSIEAGGTWTHAQGIIPDAEPLGQR